ncbi:helix-turn-helix domain-containing protein [Bradyrhizobium oligotrophicum]|uniref:helix-turn-helix domain-containing protein n=1 Tax=Bradyrhizobium oligotrophicum TaxID=44255 RepID=UPI003EBDFFAC
MTTSSKLVPDDEHRRKKISGACQRHAGASVESLALTIPEAAALSSLRQTSIYKAIKEGRLRCRKFGTRTIITRADLASFLNDLPLKADRP